MPKARPVSLHPLSFDDAIKALIRVAPQRVGTEQKIKKKLYKAVKKKKSEMP